MQNFAAVRRAVSQAVADPGIAGGGVSMLSVRPEGPTLEARRAESGGRVLGDGAASPSPPARGSGGAL